MLTEAEYNEAFHNYYRVLCFFCEGIIKSKEDSEDIVQDIFLKLHQKRENTTQETVKAFLFVSVKNRSLNYVRHQDTKRVYEKVMQSASYTEEHLLNRLIHAEFMRLVMEEIERIPGEKKKRVFKLCYLNGMSNQEIAALEGTSVNTIKEHKGKALAYLRSVLANFKPYRF